MLKALPKSDRYLIYPELKYHQIRWIKEILPVLTTEIGGALEFYKSGEFARFTVYTAKPHEGAAQLTLDDSFSIEYHLHHDPKAVALPSIADLKACYKKRIGYVNGKKNISGQANVVFANEGVFVYRYKSKEILEKEVFEDLMKEIRAIHLVGKDTNLGLKKQIEEIHRVSEGKFEIIYFNWNNLKTGSLFLGEICLKEAVMSAGGSESSMSFFRQAKRWFSL